MGYSVVVVTAIVVERTEVMGVVNNDEVVENLAKYVPELKMEGWECWILSSDRCCSLLRNLIETSWAMLLPRPPTISIWYEARTRQTHSALEYHTNNHRHLGRCTQHRHMMIH